MGFADFLSGIFNRVEPNEDGTKRISLSEYMEKEKEFFINAYCLFSVIDFVSTLMSTIELQTFYGGVKTEGLEWARLNIRPNKNQNATQFWKEFWAKLLYYQEVLVFPVGEELIIADSFIHHPEYAVREDVFEHITRGEMTFYGVRTASEVFYLNYSTVDIRSAINTVLDMYSDMTSHSYNVYAESGGEKGVLNVNSAATGPEEFEKKYGKWINNRFKSYFDAKNAVMPLFKGMTYTGKTTDVRSETSKNFTELIDSAMARTCNAYKVPPAVLRGEVAGMSDAFDVLLTTCIDPLAKLLKTEIMSKEFSLEDITERGCKINAFTNNIKHKDIFDAADPFDKLFATGFSHNELCNLLDMPTIDEEWANKHYVTKNYGEALAQEGGENGE